MGGAAMTSIYPANVATGQSPQRRLRTTGVIRPGIKMLGPRSRNDSTIAAAFKALEEKGYSYETIEKALNQRFGADKIQLIPSNVPYFRVCGEDFDDPANAQRLLQLYGEDRGQGTQLYRIPIWFTTDDLTVILPNALAMFNARERVFWSEWRNAKRYCMRRPDPVATGSQEKNRRFKRPFGPRMAVVREDRPNGCDPNSCAEYQAEACSLTAELVAMVPGIMGAAPVRIPFGSIVALDQIQQQLMQSASIRGGRISGFDPDGKPLFTLTKRRESIVRLNRDTGRSERVEHWIMVIDEHRDVSHLAAEAARGTAEETQHAHVSRGEQRSRLLASLAEQAIPAEEFARVMAAQLGPDWATTPDAFVRASKRLKEAQRKFASVEALASKCEVTENDFISMGQAHGDGWAYNLNALKAIEQQLIAR